MATGQSTATHDSTPEPSSQSDRRRQSGRFAKGFSYSPTTQIQPGQHLSSATEIQSGQRLSPKTEFKKGQAARNKLPLGSVTVRTNRKTGVSRAWVKVAEPNVWRLRAIVVWESIQGKLPKGKLVHHKDRNPLNDDIDNLAAMTRGEHFKEHEEELRSWRT